MTTNQIPTFEIEDYEEVKKISQRNFLYKSKFDGKFVTIKQIDKQDYEAEYFFKNEINIMNILKGPNSTSFLGNSESNNYYYIMMEYDNSVNLEKYLKRRSPF